jgi:hypothetical protein
LRDITDLRTEQEFESIRQVGLAAAALALSEPATG